MTLSPKIQKLMNHFIETNMTLELSKRSESNLLSAFNALTPEEAKELHTALQDKHPKLTEDIEKK